MLMLVTCLLALAPSPAQEFVQLQRADGGSVAGAEVRSVRIELPLGPRAPLSLEMLDDPDRAVDGVAIADESGRVDVGALEGEWLVATLPGWWGCRLGRSDEPAPNLTLHSDHELLVQVVDDVDGKPLGDVPVRMRPGFGPVRSARDTGMVRFRHVEFLRHEWFGADGARVQVEAFPESSGAHVQLPEPFDARPIVLRHTALPTLRIEAVDEEGLRIKENFEALLAHDPKTAPTTSASAIHHRDGTARPPWIGPGETLVLAGQDGLATAERVDVRAGLFAYVRRNALSDWNGRVVDPALAGPLPLQLGEGCESVVATLRLGEERISTGTVRVRRAVAWREDPWRRAIDSRWNDWVALPTSEIRIDLAPKSRAGLGVIAFSLTTSDGKERFTLVDLRGRAAEPVHALDVDLADCDAAVSGFVLDRRGRPVIGATIHLEQPGLEMDGTPSAAAWGAFDVGSSVSDSNGRFEIPCPPNGLFRVVASAPGFYDESRYGVVAREELTLRLSGLGDLRGTLRATGPLGSADLNVLLLRYAFAGDKQPSAGFTLGCSCDGVFEFKKAREGRYTLLVRRARSGAPPIELLRVEDIEIAAGEVTDLGELRVE
jgi:hypothetical protein